MANIEIEKLNMVAIVTEGGYQYAVPYGLLAQSGESVFFQNLSKDPVLLLFPEEDLFDKPQLSLAPGEHAALVISKGKEPGGYPYIVYNKIKKTVSVFTGYYAAAAIPKIIIVRKIN